MAGIEAGMLHAADATGTRAMHAMQRFRHGTRLQ
jgi:hypothetical protein